MKKFKVYTKWIGYSEIEVEAKSEEEAGEKVLNGDYSMFREASTMKRCSRLSAFSY